MPCWPAPPLSATTAGIAVPPTVHSPVCVSSVPGSVNEPANVTGVPTRNAEPSAGLAPNRPGYWQQTAAMAAVTPKPGPCAIMGDMAPHRFHAH